MGRIVVSSAASETTIGEAETQKSEDENAKNEKDEWHELNRTIHSCLLALTHIIAKSVTMYDRVYQYMVIYRESYLHISKYCFKRSLVHRKLRAVWKHR